MANRFIYELVTESFTRPVHLKMLYLFTYIILNWFYCELSNNWQYTLYSVNLFVDLMYEISITFAIVLIFGRNVSLAFMILLNYNACKRVNHTGGLFCHFILSFGVFFMRF